VSFIGDSPRRIRMNAGLSRIFFHPSIKAPCVHLCFLAFCKCNVQGQFVWHCPCLLGPHACSQFIILFFGSDGGWRTQYTVVFLLAQILYCHSVLLFCAHSHSRHFLRDLPSVPHTLNTFNGQNLVFQWAKSNLLYPTGAT